MKRKLKLLAVFCCCSFLSFAVTVNGDSTRIKNECRYEKFQLLAQREYDLHTKEQSHKFTEKKATRKKIWVSRSRKRKSSSVHRFHEGRISRCFKL